MNFTSQDDHWDFVRQYLHRRPGFHLGRIEKLAGIKSGTLSHLLQTNHPFSPQEAMLVARVLNQFGLLTAEIPDITTIPPREVLVPDMLNWIEKHRVVQIAWIERTTGMSNTQLSRAIRTGILPEKYDRKLLSVLLLYGYSMPPALTG